MRRQGIRLLVALIAALPIVGFEASASAAPVDLTCTGSVTINLSPGVGLLSILAPTFVNTTGTATANACISVPLGALPYTSGTGTFTGGGVISCVGVGGVTGSVTGTLTMTWNNGATSVIPWTVVVGSVLPIVLAHVESGAMAGALAQAVPAAPIQLVGTCALTPVTSFTVIGAATILKL